MAELLQKRKITHVLKISAQSEQLQQRYCRFYWFLKSACLRYVSTWGRDCVSGVLPCLVHSQNLSKLIGHSDDGQKPNRTAVQTRYQRELEATFQIFCQRHLYLPPRLSSDWITRRTTESARNFSRLTRGTASRFV